MVDTRGKIRKELKLSLEQSIDKIEINVIEIVNLLESGEEQDIKEAKKLAEKLAKDLY